MSFKHLLFLMLSFGLIAEGTLMCAAAQVMHNATSKEVPIAQSNNFSTYWQRIIQNKFINLDTQEYFSGKTLLALRQEHPHEPLILAVVPEDKPDLFNIPGARVYEAQHFNQYILTTKETEVTPAGRDLAGLGNLKVLQGPQKENLRVVFPEEIDWGGVQKLGVAEVCYIKLDPAGTQFTYVYSLSDLVEGNNSAAREFFQGLNHDKKVDYNNFSQLSLGTVHNGPISLELGVHRKPSMTYYAKTIALLAAVSFLHGICNNWLGRRAKEDNTWFLKAPAREWGTSVLFGILKMGLYLKSMGNPLIIAREGNQRSFKFFNVLAATSAQMLGEVLPLPGYAGYRSVACNNLILGLLTAL